MAENKEGQEKTESATPKRLSEAKEKGQVSKSTDITTSVMVLIGGMSLFVFGATIYTKMIQFFDYSFRNSWSIKLTEANVLKMYPDLITFIASLILPLLLLFMFLILAAEISQVGLTVATKKWTDPETYKKIFKIGSGLKRIFFSSQSFFELLKSVAKVILLGAVIMWIVYDDLESIVTIPLQNYTALIELMADLSFKIILGVGLAYIVIAVSDLMFQKWKHKEDMKMTKQEVKDETKQSEGDPHVKGKLKGLIRSRFRKMMIQNVAEADVVITNPTHFAVALKYDNNNMGAPRVVAKGADFLAARIREVAKENGVQIVEDPPLARTLFFNVEIDMEVPENLYKAVAQVLAYVFSLKGKRG
ncbi:MAG: flagellar biosynthesis protein FlhB [Ignavibacteriae bacterium HGW-Ignavibacteriae-4]|jgi:flagellar biosynthetic protein FlhB|nr:MAG: flagellar biosynthesis protein FlhB [Ignavibacteriae bacterium HGW-Ignavibacteriae-4]